MLMNYCGIILSGSVTVKVKIFTPVAVLIMIADLFYLQSVGFGPSGAGIDHADTSASPEFWFNNPRRTE